MSIRSYRRNRHRHKEHLRQLDKIAKERIHRSFMASMSTWGGTRCPDCGANCRPHQLFPQYSGYLVDGDNRVTGHISVGPSPDCSKIKGCNPDYEWDGM